MEWTNELFAWIIAGCMPVLCGIFWPVLLVPWFLYVAWFVYTQFVAPKYLNPYGRVIYVTGCDSGFGHAVALEMDLQGCYVFAGCLYPDGQGAEALKAQASDRLQILDLDVTDEQKVNQCAKHIETFCSQNNLPGLWALYNNAGIAVAGEIEWFPMEDYLRAMNINVWGTVRVTKSVLHLIRNTKGRVVTVTSGISRAVNPGRSGYCMPKSALEAFMDSLRYEMHKFGVKCCTINPGNFTGVTGIFDSLARSLDTVILRINRRIRTAYGETYLNAFRDSVCSGYRGEGSAISVDAVTKAVKDAILQEHPRIRYKPTQFGWIVWWFVHGLLPEEITDRIVAYWQRNMPTPASCN